VSDVDSLDGTAHRVTLITLHQVKGWSSLVVFIAGLEEGLLPHIRALEEVESGIAGRPSHLRGHHPRAAPACTCCTPSAATSTAPPSSAAASRFLDELPKELLETPRRPGMAAAAPVPAPGGGWRAAVHATRCGRTR